MSDIHLKETALADRLGLSVRTLQRWRWQGKGPAYLKLGHRVAYREEDVRAWEEKIRKLGDDDPAEEPDPQPADDRGRRS
jgi:predicted DNA-binding transcriptional regulator AlpA